MKGSSIIKGSSTIKDSSSKKTVMFFLKCRPKAGKLAYSFFMVESSIVKDSWTMKGSSIIQNSSIAKDSSSIKSVMFFSKSRPKAGKLAYSFFMGESSIVKDS